MKKKVALSATAIVVLASTVPTHVALVQAEETREPIYVKFNSSNGNNAGGGAGTKASPFNQFRDALNKAQNGDTIIIIGQAFVNDTDNNGLPLYIDKAVTIKSEEGTHATLSIRPGGVVLGADVTLENIALSMDNKDRDSIFVNGHTLNLTDVTRASGSREVDIFGGTHYHSSAPTYNMGQKSVINITTTGALSGSSEFGNIYGGSMLGDFSADVEINLINNGSAGKLTVKGIKGSGATEAIPGALIGFTEPAPPKEDPTLFHMNGDVHVNLQNVYPSIDGTTGGTGKTSVEVSTKYNTNLTLKEIHSLTVNSGTIIPINFQDESMRTIDTVHLATDTILDLTESNGNFTINNYTGTGSIMLRNSEANLNITNPITASNSINLLTKGGTKFNNGRVTLNQVYITTANQDASILFTPNFADEDYELRALEKNSRFEWTIVDPKNLPSSPEGGDEPTVPTITGFEKDNYLTSGTGASDISTVFKVNFSDSSQEKVEFHEIEGSKVSFNGEELVLRDGKYTNSDNTVTLSIEAFSTVGTYSICLERKSEQELLPVGKHSFVLEASGQEATIDFDVKPIIDTLTEVGSKEATVTKDTDKPSFEFTVDGRGDLSALDLVEDFKIKINGKDTEKQTVADDGKVYYKSLDSKVEAYIEYDELTNKHTLFLQPISNDDTPVYTKEQYTIELSSGDGVEPLTFIVNVEKEEEPPAPPIEPTEPVVTNATFTSTEQTVINDSAFVANYDFSVTTEGNVALTSPFTKPFTFTVDDKVAEYREESDSYFLEHLGLTFRVVQRTGDNQLQLVVTGDGEKLKAGNHNITFGIAGKEYTQNLSLQVKEATPPPSVPDPDPELPTPDTTEVTYTLPEGQANQEETVTKIAGMLSSHDFFITPQFVPTTPNVDSFLNGLTVTIGGHKAERVGESYLWIAEDVDVSLGIGPTGDDGYKVSFNPVKPSDGSILDDGQYTATIQYGDSNPVATFKLNVESEQVTPTPPPVVDPDPVDPAPPTEPDDKEEEEEEEVKPPTVDVVIFPQGSTKTVDVDKATLGVELPLNLTLSQTETKVVDFKDLGYSVAINGKTATLNGVDYVLADSDIRVTFTNKGNGLWQAFLFKQGTDGKRLPLPVGTYSISAVAENSKDFEFSIVVKDTTPKPPSGTTPPSGGINPPSGGSGNTGGSSSGGTVTPPPSTGGGTTLPAPDPKPEKPVEKPPVVDKPTPVPPKQEETKPTTRPTVKPDAVASKPEALEKLPAKIQEKVDSLLTEVVEQAKGLVLDLTGDKDDLSSVSTLEVTNEGVFANVDGERVKFASDLKLNDMSKLRITRTDGSPIPYKTNGTGFTITTRNFSDILITERVVEPFVDVAKDDWFQPYVDEMYNRGITTGTTATSFSPNESITRAQLAALLARTYELKPTGEKPVLTDTANQWYAADVQALVDLGIIKGYGDGTFRGDEPITREHLVIMLQRLAEKLGKDANPVKEFNFTDTAKMSTEGKSAVQWAAKQGIINSGQGTAFKPKSDATRAQVAKMLTKLMYKVEI